jgi:monoamine oxidase
VEDFLESLQADDDVLPSRTNAHLLLQLIRNDFASRVSDLGLTGLLAPDVDGYEDNYRIAEGYSEVPRRLAQGCDLRINHTASAVVRHADRVDVVTNRGVYSGNVAIVCLPVGVLQAGDVRFDPPLSQEKHDAIHGVNPGEATKLVLAFRRTRMGATFWPDEAPLLATSLATQLWWPTGYGHADQRHFLTTCLVGGAGVARFAERDPREVGLAQLGHMFGWERVRGKALSQHYVKCWHDDPLIKGGYSSLRIGVDQLGQVEALEAAEDGTTPQLYFAGDYVTRHPGSVHSAYQSGIDAVQRAAAARG